MIIFFVLNIGILIRGLFGTIYFDNISIYFPETIVWSTFYSSPQIVI